MFFTEAASFSYAPYILGVATPIPFYRQKLIFQYTVFSVGFIRVLIWKFFGIALSLYQFWNQFT